jgi:uncharacterized protein involved in exopolysaccharide biosynthesis
VDLSAVLLSITAALGTLCPLILGLLNYAKDKRKDAAAPAIPAPAATLGETVDFESVAVQSLRAQIDMLNETIADLRARLRRAERKRDANAEALQAAGLPLP